MNVNGEDVCTCDSGTNCGAVLVDNPWCQFFSGIHPLPSIFKFSTKNCCSQISYKYFSSNISICFPYFFMQYCFQTWWFVKPSEVHFESSFNSYCTAFIWCQFRKIISVFSQMWFGLHTWAHLISHPFLSWKFPNKNNVTNPIFWYFY